MSTRSAIAVRNENGEIDGRYVHFDGDAVGDEVRAMIERDGVQKVVSTLILGDFQEWSCLDANQTDTGRHIPVPGYGEAYEPQDEPGDFKITALGQAGTEYIHVIETDGTITTITD